MYMVMMMHQEKNMVIKWFGKFLLQIQNIVSKNPLQIAIGLSAVLIA